MTAAFVIAAIVVGQLGYTIHRLFDLRRFPWLVWPIALVAAASPAWVGWHVLDPGPPVASAIVAKMHDKATLDVPPGYSLLVTGELALDRGKEDAGKTVYSLALAGDRWKRQATSTVQIKSTSGAQVDVKDGAAVRESARKTSRVGEDVQERFDLPGPGKVAVEVTLWEGSAARLLHIEVVRSPPPVWILWTVAGLVTAAGLYLEVRHKADKLTGDVSFVALYGVFLQSGLTPLDSIWRVLWPAAAAALLGWGAGGALGWIALKVAERRADAAASVGTSTPSTPHPGR